MKSVGGIYTVKIDRLYRLSFLTVHEFLCTIPTIYTMKSLLLLLLLFFFSSVVATLILSEDVQIKNSSSVQNGEFMSKKRKRKMKKKGTASGGGTEDVFLNFLSPKSTISTSASYHGKVLKDAWCPDAKFCEQKENTTFYQQQALCSQRWLFILSTIKGDSPVHYNHSVSSVLKFLNALRPTIIMDIHNNMNTNMEYLVDQLTFARRFKMSNKKLAGAWIQNPIDMKTLFLDLQKLFMYTIVSTEALSSFSRQSSNKRIFAAPVNNFLTKDSFHFLKAVFPCSRIILHDIDTHKADTVPISVDNETVVDSLTTRHFPNTSFIVGRYIDILYANQNSHSMHTMLNQLIKWLGIDVEDCKISNTVCSNSDVRRISTGHCVEGECNFLNT